MPTAISKNGIASPSEKTDNKRPPWKTVARCAANVRILPRIGPTHGVHPKANVVPKIKELSGFPGVNAFDTPNVWFACKNENAGDVKNPNRYRPKNNTNAPPICDGSERYCPKIEPPSPKSIPNKIKTELNPNT